VRHAIAAGLTAIALLSARLHSVVGGWEFLSVSDKKPEPIYFPVVRKCCPVCGKPSYSLSGEHPQCALTRFDAAFKARQKKRNHRTQLQAAAK
jgi:hypothetical protein